VALILGFEALVDAIEMRQAIDLLEEALSHEAGGRTYVSPKFVSDFTSGSMRMLFAADHEAGYAATKAYLTIQGVGTRYVVSLYRLQDGELLALLDGRLITDIRTGAASGVIARKVMLSGPVSLGIIGSGSQARTQLQSLAAVFALESVVVFSPTAANRLAFAHEMSAQLGLPVKAVDSAEDAARGREVVVTASNARSSEPILRGEWLGGCRLLCAVGNTRPQFAEADVRCFRDACLVVMDTPHAVDEAGDLIQALKNGAMPQNKRATLGEIVAGVVDVPREGLIAFKSVGTALQDLALAARYYELLRDRPGLSAVADLATMRTSGGPTRP